MARCNGFYNSEPRRTSGKVYHGEGSQEEPDEQRRLVKPKGYGARSRPSLHLERVADERTVFRFGNKINGRDWRFQARRLETGINSRENPENPGAVGGFPPRAADGPSEAELPRLRGI